MINNIQISRELLYKFVSEKCIICKDENSLSYAFTSANDWAVFAIVLDEVGVSITSSTTSPADLSSEIFTISKDGIEYQKTKIFPWDSLSFNKFIDWIEKESDKIFEEFVTVYK